METYTQIIAKTMQQLNRSRLSNEQKNNHYKNLGLCYHKLNKNIDAIKWFLQITPLDYSACMSIAAIYVQLDLKKSFKYVENCLEMKYDLNVAYDLACNYTKDFQFNKSYALYQNILMIEPNYINAYNNKSEILNCMMRQKESLESYIIAYSMDNTRMDIFSNLIMSTYYIPRYLHVDRMKYLSIYDEKLTLSMPIHEHPKTTIDIQNIRIGYIGYDFDKPKHPISCFINHIFYNHGNHFKIFCYQVSTKKSSVFQSPTQSTFYTEYNERITTRNLSDKTDEEASNVIKDDKIDILIELMHHTAGNRLRILAYKPAPIQISYCAFPGTTGMSAIDYKILDKTTHTTFTEQCNTEKILCMPNGYHCFVPTYKFPKIKHTKRSTVNLCCFNNVKKINRDVISVWLHILRLVPNSHLHLRYYQYSSSFVRANILQMFKTLAKEYLIELNTDRIHFIGCEKEYTDVLQLFNFMDIFLDTFPYTGTTVICEALTMGIPVVTLQGKHVHERVGASLLNSINLAELVATNSHEYVTKVVELCQNPPKLQELKNTIQTQLPKTILGNPQIFIKDFESMIYTAINTYNQSSIVASG
jgi:protein O-GlcNAc transferase